MLSGAAQVVEIDDVVALEHVVGQVSRPAHDGVRIRPGVDVVLHTAAAQVVWDAPGHADRGASLVPHLLEIAEARAAAPVLVVTGGVTRAAVEDERAASPAPSVLA